TLPTAVVDHQFDRPPAEGRTVGVARHDRFQYPCQSHTWLLHRRADHRIRQRGPHLLVPADQVLDQPFQFALLFLEHPRPPKVVYYVSVRKRIKLPASIFLRGQVHMPSVAIDHPSRRLLITALPGSSRLTSRFAAAVLSGGRRSRQAHG